jgi:HlyD family secretion protein
MLSADKSDKFMTQQITKGNVTVEVTSTGAIQSVVTVQVGTQVSGTIKELFADFNTKVKAGQVIAKLEPNLFKANVDKEKANIASAEANILKMKAAVDDAKRNLDTADALYKAQVSQARANLAVAKANVEKAKATVIQTKLTLERDTTLVAQKTISQSEKDDAQANYDSAVAQLAASESQVALSQANLDLTEVQSKNARDGAQTAYDSTLSQLKSAEAQLSQAKAACDLAEVNFEHSIISSPIDGIVVSRAVDVGQTVAASLSAPTLFTIANDLSKMQVEATVDEADIGKIVEGQKTTFTVDAFPDDRFEGVVSQKRLSSTVVQNVVTYTVILAVSNTRNKLMPGMTANTTFHIDERESVLRVPNAALRFNPPDSVIEPEELAKIKEMQEKFKSAGLGEGRGGGQGGFGRPGGGTGRGGEGRPRGEGMGRGEGGGRMRGARVWVKTANNLLKSIRLKPGLADGKCTELLEGDLKEGDEVVVGTTEAAPSTTPTTSPFGGIRRF